MLRISYKKIAKYPLFISICIHATAFILLGFIVFDNTPTYKEPVNVELVTIKQRTQRLRSIAPRIQKSVSDAIEPANNPQNISTAFLISQPTETSYIVSGATPTPQYKPVNILADVYYEKPSAKFLLSTPEPKISLPETRKTQIVSFNIQDQLPLSSALHNMIAYSVSETPDPKILQDFLQTISKKIEKSKRYPKWAMQMELEGKVVIKFVIHQDGKLDPNIQITNSSGTEILDQAAIAAVKSASPFPNLPNELRREYIQIELPMSFRLGG